ncbi:MAG: sel1 repeat family protein [Acidobacteriia bacterium]|nr:sel1 repeat family protein [Terriglobia bacterium]
MKSAARGRGTPPASRPKNAPQRDGKRQSPPLWIPAILALIFAGFALLPRVNANPHLQASFLASAGILLAGLCALWWSVVRTGRTLTYEFVPRRVHWVQLIMHSSVYAYWGWYWREVYHEIPLIVAQVFFLYVLDMLVCWSRRGKWILGFGPIPIIFSMNLFLWFRDDWFYLQFIMVAIIVFGKEFLRWKRDGHLTHIFNPSAFALFLTSVVLLVTRTTPITWGPEISQTFNNPPNIYLEIFLLGLIVQALFSVTLVTLSSAAMLCLLNVVYTRSTGMYFFIDFNIHPAVFLGLHLLVTDPATSPRKNFGKVIFGAGYGAGVFALFGLLNGLGAPEFYDKLLCVPALNLTVRALDRFSIALSAWFARQSWVIEGKLRPLQALSTWSPQRANFGFMGIWIALFGTMAVTGFVTGKQPGSDPAFWQKPCEAGSTKACQVLARTLDAFCQNNSPRACFTLGTLLSRGKELPRDPIGAARSFGHACGLGFESACTGLADLARTDGGAVLQQPCSRGDGASCYLLGSLYYGGQGVSRNFEYSAALFQQSCAAGFTRGCGQWGESYLFGEGVPKDISKAREILENACDAGYAPGCFNVGLMHRQGIETPKNEPLALARFRRGCDLGYQNACQALQPPPSAR